MPCEPEAVGQDVLQSLSPGQQVVKIVRDELVDMLGGENARVHFTSQPPTVIMLVGLQGAGKTTSAGKLSKWLAKNGHRPMLVSVDVYRPAAREQLKVIAQRYRRENLGRRSRATNRWLYARTPCAKPATLDMTCSSSIPPGACTSTKTLMKELGEIKKQSSPHEILFVADAMLGQDAVKSAQQFHEQLGFNGFILTKMDGDARGGAALSIKQVTGQPVKFVGTGEKYDALELFHPDRLVSRIMGMGDIMSLIEKAEEVVDKKQALELQEKIRKTVSPWKISATSSGRCASWARMEQILGMLPSIGPFKDLQKAKVDEKELVRIEAIINSMTPKERRNHQMINGSRRKRIAKGSGTSVQAVNQL